MEQNQDTKTSKFIQLEDQNSTTSYTLRAEGQSNAKTGAEQEGKGAYGYGMNNPGWGGGYNNGYNNGYGGYNNGYNGYNNGYGGRGYNDDLQTCCTALALCQLCLCCMDLAGR